MNKTTVLIVFFSLIFFSLSVFVYLNVSSQNPHRDSDSIRYEGKADLFHKTNRFFPPCTENNEPVAPQPIGYAFFIGIVHKIFGQKDWPIIWLQILLTLLSGFFVFFAAKHLFGKTIAITSFAFFVTNIGYLVFAQFILAECLTVLFLTWYFERFCYFIKTKSIVSLMLSGLILGMSTLVKPAGLYFIYPSAIFAIFVLYKTPKRLLYIPFLLSMFFLPIKSLQMYNAKTYGHTNFTNVGTFNLYVWFWGKAEANAKPKKEFDSYDKNLKEFRKQKLDILYKNGKPNWKRLSDRFWFAFKKNPFPFVFCWLKEMSKTAFGLFTTNLKILVGSHQKGSEAFSFFLTKGPMHSRIHQYVSNGAESLTVVLLGYLEILWSLFRLILFAVGLLYLTRKNQWLIISFFLSYIGYLTLVSGFDGCARYRVMFEFAILIFSALGFSNLFLQKKVKNVSKM
jgi:4-amino-4-deoxy-L-arabinose transferase-like glycosyltransferase